MLLNNLTIDEALKFEIHSLDEVYSEKLLSDSNQDKRFQIKIFI